MKVKVCGMTEAKQIKDLIQMGIDYAGMIFYEKSPRYVVGKIEPEELKNLSKEIQLTGVFVNEEIEVVQKRINEFHLSAVQLCGEETPDYCEELRQSVGVLKVVPVYEDVDIFLLKKYADVCDYFLFDTQSKKYGGTGVQFNWDLLTKMEINKPFFLSGGIGENDVDRILQFHQDQFYAIDINSRFEISPGKKNMPVIKLFLEQIN